MQAPRGDSIKHNSIGQGKHQFHKYKIIVTYLFSLYLFHFEAKETPIFLFLLCLKIAVLLAAIVYCFAVEDVTLMIGEDVLSGYLLLSFSPCLRMSVWETVAGSLTKGTGHAYQGCKT